jgi:hypothetical protein
MVVYVVKDMICGTSDCEDVLGVYSNLALAGRAVMQIIKKYSNDDDDIITFDYHVESWGYYFEILTGSDKWLCGEMEIVRMVVNE